LEEPLWPPENYEGLSLVRKASKVPIAAGENVPTLMDFERLMASGAVDFVQPSPAKMGRFFDLEAQLYGDALTPKGGRIVVPTSPGLGIQPDPCVIRDYGRSK
jgi:L-alanine-DL-glutamate epimerase-like enolase superfamily enzyme